MPHEQLTLIKRTDEELKVSIAEKRQKYGLKAKLDPDETDLLLRQIHEDEKDRNSIYKH